MDAQRDEMDFGRLLKEVAGELRAAGVEDAAAEARLLLRSMLGWSAEEAVLRRDDPLDSERLGAVRAAAARRAAREPLQHISGSVEFWGREFGCSADALVPRPETELLVELALGRMARGAALRVADVCTGSGVIAVTLKMERPRCQVWASDLSEAALALARANGARHGAEVEWAHCDLFGDGDGRYDVVLCNPPYIPSGLLGGLQPEVRREPRMALDGGADGMAVAGGLLRALPGRLVPGGAALVEVGPEIAGAALELARRVLPGAEAGVERDYNGLERLLVISSG